jgi:hypothetical protein
MTDQPPPDPAPSPPQAPAAAAAPPTGANVLGIIGFVLALIGLIFGWCFWPVAIFSLVGAILGFVGMFRPPRGLAIAAFVIGLVGCLVLLLLTVALGIVSIGAAGLASMAPRIEGDMERLLIVAQVDEFVAANDRLPASLDELANLDEDVRIDFWGNPYRYEVDEEMGTYVLTSDGPDGVADTEDDLALHP